MNHNARRAANAATARETRTVLPDILKELPDLVPSKSEALFLETLPALKASECPKHEKVAVKIVNQDTFNAAIDLAKEAGSSGTDAGRVVVLNMASNINPGGGWLKGSTAQEEALCYRSSLSLSLHKRYYPFQARQGIYSPDVVVIRSDMASGHKLLVPETQHADLPVVSVLSIAGLRRPDVANAPANPDSSSSGTRPGKVFANDGDREMTKDKMRLALRIAASKGHGLLVLGAIGCGAFRNPPEEVANCWLEVLREPEFSGGWWKGVWFAVFDNRNEGNFEVFEEVLGGQEF
jgi:hypothetical protein